MYSRPELIMCLFCFIDTFDCFETMVTVGPGLVGPVCSQWRIQPGSRLEALFVWLFQLHSGECIGRLSHHTTEIF